MSASEWWWRLIGVQHILPRTEPSTYLITAHKVNNRAAHVRCQRRDFQALPKHRVYFQDSP